MMRHILVRLSEDGTSEPDELCDLDFVRDSWGPPSRLRERGGRQLDWGSMPYEVTRDEIGRLIAPRPDYSDIREDWDRPFREAREEQDALIAALPADGRYGIVWEEQA